MGAAAMGTDSDASEAMAGSYASISCRVMKPTPRTDASQGSGPRAVRHSRPSACRQGAAGKEGRLVAQVASGMQGTQGKARD